MAYRVYTRSTRTGILRVLRAIHSYLGIPRDERAMCAGKELFVHVHTYAVPLKLAGGRWALLVRDEDMPGIEEADLVIDDTGVRLVSEELTPELVADSEVDESYDPKEGVP